MSNIYYVVKHYEHLVFSSMPQAIDFIYEMGFNINDLDVYSYQYDELSNEQKEYLVEV